MRMKGIMYSFPLGRGTKGDDSDEYQTPSEGITSSINVTSLNPSSRRENKYLKHYFPLGRGTKGDDS
jgi:hypothetical protein